MVGADVGYEMLGDDAGSARLANQDPLLEQKMEEPGLRAILCGHLSSFDVNYSIRSVAVEPTREERVRHEQTREAKWV